MIKNLQGPDTFTYHPEKFIVMKKNPRPAIGKSARFIENTMMRKNFPNM